MANRVGDSGATVVGGDWVAEYNLTQYYAIRDVSAESLHHLADKLRIGTAHETTMFNKYVIFCIQTCDRNTKFQSSLRKCSPNEVDFNCRLCFKEW